MLTVTPNVKSGKQRRYEDTKRTAPLTSPTWPTLHSDTLGSDLNAQGPKSDISDALKYEHHP